VDACSPLPVGDTLRTRCRNFPGMVNNTVIDWFTPWPTDALRSVSQVFLKDLDMPEAFRETITEHMVRNASLNPRRVIRSPR
jgi:dynein heavy chain